MKSVIIDRKKNPKIESLEKYISLIFYEYYYLQDAHTSAWFLTIACMVSFGLWLDIICIFFIAAIVFSFVALNQSKFHSSTQRTSQYFRKCIK